MKSQSTLLHLCLLCFLLLFLASCNEDKDTDIDKIAESLSDKLSSALVFEDGVVVEGAPPAGQEGDDAPQVDTVESQDSLVLGQSFPLRMKLANPPGGATAKLSPLRSAKYDSVSDVVYTIVYVEGATKYIRVDVSLFDEEGDFWAELFGALAKDEELKGKSFRVLVAFQTADGTTGLYKEWNLTILNEDEANPEDIAQGLNIPGAEIVHEAAPLGMAGDDAPQIIGIRGPTELAPGDDFSLVLLTDYPNAQDITHAILAIPTATGYLLVQSVAQPVDGGFEVSVPGQVPEGMTVYEWTMTFMVALRNAAGNVGLYRDWTFHLVPQSSIQPPNCDDENPCTTDTLNDDGTCSYDFMVCNDDVECTLDFCNPMSGQCEFFLKPDTCLIDDECVAAGTVSETNDCEACLPEIATDMWSANDGATCDDGNACTQRDICRGNQCVGGNAVECEDGNSCRDSNGCNPETGECEYVNRQNGTVCTADESLCTSDSCQEGVCVAGNRLSCPNQNTNPCKETAGSCNDATGQCVYTDKQDGTGCDRDGDACTLDQCQAGRCVFDEPKTCPGEAGPCASASVCNPVDGSCSQQLRPTGTLCHPDGEENLCLKYTCSDEGLCVADTQTPQLDCPAPGPCWETGSCNPTTGRCEFVPKALDMACDLDGSACTPDTCDGNGQCLAGTPVSCEAPGQCRTGGTCNARTGQCVYQDKPQGAPCDLDANLCTLDQCNGTGACLEGVDKNCGEPEQCQSSVTCNPQTGACDVELMDDTSPCDLDDSQCTPDFCQEGQCLAGEPVVCDPPANPCLMEGVCEPRQGTCQYDPFPDDSPCDRDENLCTLDYCYQGYCQPGEEKTCEPSSGCMIDDGCDPQTGICVEHPEEDGAYCDDQDETTYASRCYDEECVGLQWKKRWSVRSSSFNDYAYSRDANRLAILDETGELFLLDAYTGRHVGPTFAKAPEDNAYRKVAYSQDGSRIVATYWDTYVLFDALTGRTLKTKRTNIGDFAKLALSSDGRLLVAAFDYGTPGLKVFEAATGVLVGSIYDGYGGTPEIFAIQPGSNHIVATHGSDIALWYWNEEDQSYGGSYSFENQGYYWENLTFSADGMVMVGITNNSSCAYIFEFTEDESPGVDGDGPIGVYGEIQPPDSVRTVCGINGLRPIAALNDNGSQGAFVTYNQGDQIVFKMLDYYGDTIGIIPLQSRGEGYADVRQLFVSKDGLIGFVEGEWLRVYIVDGETGENLIHQAKIGGDYSYGFSGGKFTADGTGLATQDGERVMVRESLTGKVREEVQLVDSMYGEQIWDFYLPPFDEQIAASIDGRLTLFEYAESTWYQAWQDQASGSVNEAVYSANGTWFARVRYDYVDGYNSYSLQVFDAHQLAAQPTDVIIASSVPVEQIAFSPDEQYVSYVSYDQANKQLVIVNITDQEEAYYVVDGLFTGYKWFSDGARLLIYSSDGVGAIYDFPALTSTPTYFPSYENQSAVYPDGSLIVAPQYGRLVFWEPESTEPLTQWSVNGEEYGGMYNFVMAPTGEYMLAWGEMEPTILQHQTIRCVAQLDGMPCDDGNPATTEDRCLGGVCQGVACECQSGPCCDGCHFLSSENICAIGQVSSECIDEYNGCQGTWYGVVAATYCSGNSSQCDGPQGETYDYTMMECEWGYGCGGQPGECQFRGGCY